MNKFLSVHLLWLMVLFAPVQAQAQKEKVDQDTAFVLPADTVLPGQKKPFTDAQRLEGDNKRFLMRAVIPSAALVGAGILTIQERGFISSFDTRNARNRHFPNFSTEADDFIMIAPLVGLYGFNIISSQNRHEMGRQTLLLGLSGALASAIIWPVKGITDIERPNGEPHAFPSGHTAYAFTIATFMDKEFRHKSPWVSVASYGIAGATGVLRVLNNAHWMADVLAGAGVGIISVNTVYWVHAKLTHGGGLKRTSFVPAVFPGGARGMAVTVAF
ncbi:phosphatase PAP2 family protein [Pontibacter beigongshangensis]|uniref:phosphatase PAP2 family protein n=1 Tax=Pontibacter beigongshangensis TaxID=2574733 RepID=UPI00164F2910|nr:phosphatase PAP2 family protein [Pontibacter beigongshangensis]